VQLESRTQFMAPRKKKTVRADPDIVFEGMEEILERDLAKHKGILQQTKLEMGAYSDARSYEVRKKRHYKSLVNEGKYDRESMDAAIAQIDINLRHMLDKKKLSMEKITHHEEIISKLEEELANQYKGLKQLAKQRKDGTAD